MIDNMTAELAKAPKLEPTSKAEEAPETSDHSSGMYYYDGKAYRAKKSQRSGGFYVEELLLEPKPAFVYARGVVKNITPEHKMPPEQAAMFSKNVGACLNCLRELTANESLRRVTVRSVPPGTAGPMTATPTKEKACTRMRIWKRTTRTAMGRSTGAITSECPSWSPGTSTRNWSGQTTTKLRKTNDKRSHLF